MPDLCFCAPESVTAQQSPCEQCVRESRDGDDEEKRGECFFFFFVLVVVKRGGSKQIGQINTRHYLQAEASNQLQARVLTRLLAEPELEPVNDKHEIIKFRDGGKQLCVACEDCVFVCFCSCSCEDTFPKRCSFQEFFFSGLKQYSDCEIIFLQFNFV